MPGPFHRPPPGAKDLTGTALVYGDLHDGDPYDCDDSECAFIEHGCEVRFDPERECYVHADGDPVCPVCPVNRAIRRERAS